MVPSPNWEQGYGTPSSSCRQNNTLGSWIPPANRSLDVKLEGPSGAVSEVGWPACCASCSLRPFPSLPLVSCCSWVM